jgi:hypothetical protein
MRLGLRLQRLEESIGPARPGPAELEPIPLTQEMVDWIKEIGALPELGGEDPVGMDGKDLVRRMTDEELIRFHSALLPIARGEKKEL